MRNAFKKLYLTKSITSFVIFAFVFVLFSVIGYFIFNHNALAADNGENIISQGNEEVVLAGEETKEGVEEFAATSQVILSSDLTPEQVFLLGNLDFTASIGVAWYEITKSKPLMVLVTLLTVVLVILVVREFFGKMRKKSSK